MMLLQPHDFHLKPKGMTVVVPRRRSRRHDPSRREGSPLETRSMLKVSNQSPAPGGAPRRAIRHLAGAREDVTRDCWGQFCLRPGYVYNTLWSISEKGLLWASLGDLSSFWIEVKSRA